MEPRLEIEPFTCDGPGPPWHVSWTVRNHGSEPVRLLTAVQPHSQFRTQETEVGLGIAPQSSVELVLRVQFDEPAGSVVENPFLILRFVEGATEYRALARVRVVAGPDGEPTATGSVVTTLQRVGATGVEG